MSDELKQKVLIGVLATVGLALGAWFVFGGRGVDGAAQTDTAAAARVARVAPDEPAPKRADRRDSVAEARPVANDRRTREETDQPDRTRKPRPTSNTPRRIVKPLPPGV